MFLSPSFHSLSTFNPFNVAPIPHSPLRCLPFLSPILHSHCTFPSPQTSLLSFCRFIFQPSVRSNSSSLFFSFSIFSPLSFISSRRFASTALSSLSPFFGGSDEYQCAHTPTKTSALFQGENSSPRSTQYHPRIPFPTTSFPFLSLFFSFRFPFFLPDGGGIVRRLLSRVIYLSGRAPSS